MQIMMPRVDKVGIASKCREKQQHSARFLQMPCTMFEVLADVIEMENGENKTTIDVVVISDHKDSENKHPLDIYRAED